MYVAFDQITDEARVWIYQADRQLSTAEQQLIQEAGQEFLNSWGAHGHDLHASITLKYHHFVLIAVDNSVQLPTGCSIDQSVHFITALGQKIGVDFFNRTRVSVWQNNSVLLKDLNQIKREVEQGSIKRDTLIFNNLVSIKADLENWKIPAIDSWIGRYFKQQVN